MWEMKRNQKRKQRNAEKLVQGNVMKNFQKRNHAGSAVPSIVTFD